jgi:hypothetical protein
VSRRFFHLFVGLALIVAVGGHWSLLQSVAWVRMAVQYSKDAPLGVALQKTFDGRHPCKLCRVVREGKGSEEKRAAKQVETKLDFFCLPNALSLAGPERFPVIADVNLPAPSRAESPPRPPPRVS